MIASTLRSMLAVGLLGCALTGASLEPLPPGGFQVLFIGNSLTYTNDLPGTISALASSVGDTIRVRSVALPDFALIDHVNGGSNAVDVIRSQKWSMVVLQQGPSTLPVNRDTLVLATQKFDPFIKAAGARSGAFMTWPSSDRPGDFERVLGSSQLAAKTVGGVLLPAGQAWLAAWAKDAQLPLYGPDGFHPGELGTYLAALVIYEGITGHDARLLPSRAVVAGRELNMSAATVRMLQTVAHETVVAYP
ncbi:MAG: hypothetical protein ABI664_04050 [bacterium]